MLEYPTIGTPDKSGNAISATSQTANGERFAIALSSRLTFNYHSQLYTYHTINRESSIIDFAGKLALTLAREVGVQQKTRLVLHRMPSLIVSVM